MSFVVYTANIGGYDLPRPTKRYRGVEFILLTDRHPTVQARGWEVRIVKRFFDDPVRDARRCKVLPCEYFPETEYTIWHDANTSLKVSPWVLVGKHLQKHDLAAFAHPARDCLYEEAVVCARHKLDDPEIIEAQMRRYREDGYPEHHGLISSGFLVRRHSKAILDLCDLWWEEIRRGSRRDQLSFNYVIWKLGFSYTLMPGTYPKLPYFRVSGGHGRKAGRIWAP